MKWDEFWRGRGVYEPNLKQAKRPFYNLMMFPYPSAEGLHVGNMYAFVGSDIYGRFKRMQGHDVFEPIGLDGFGIHSENYALQVGRHPAKQAKISEKNFYRQLGMIGNGFAWKEKLETYDPEYYKWTQWIFVQMFKKGLAYRKKQTVNWCPDCKTVLADEQVISGECERCESKVIKKELEQWFFKITDYAEQLLRDLNKIDWSEKVKIAQRNWIGRSEGALIDFQILNTNYKMQVFTTRPDTLFGATYMVLSPEHELISKIKNQISNIREVEEYIKKAKAKTEQERIAEGKEKTGVELKGVKAMNPATKEKIPIWVADYVLGHVGTGAIMAVPAHDQRDFEFAKKYGLSIQTVVVPSRMNCIIVHGCPEKKEELEDVTKNIWISWIKRELEKIGIKIFTPQMPIPWEPSYEAWKREFEKLPVNDESILIGHSCSGAFLVRWLGEKQVKIRKLILVAPVKIPSAEANQATRNLYNFQINNNIKTFVDEILIFVSDNEIERRRKSARLYSEALGGNLIELKQKGHFTFRDMKTNEFPELLEAILCPTNAFTGEGILVNSGQFKGAELEKAKWKITKFVGGERKTQYRLRDWLISRQRYWGPPIPMIFCEKCDWQAVPEKDLPVKLPFIKNYRPKGKGVSPLATEPKFYKTKCPKCWGEARRETDVSDNFLDSAWYFFRYLDTKNKKEIFSKAIAKKWLPVNMYIGGVEHSVLHLLYVRFLAKVFRDLGLVHFSEPFPKFRAHGLLIKDGAKMSKSRGNVVNPDAYIKKFGADALRMYLMFLGPFDQGGDFRDTGILGITRFLNRVRNLEVRLPAGRRTSEKNSERILHQSIKKITEDIENLRYNTAISQLMILLNGLEKYGAERTAYGIFLKLLAPFAPYISEELWQKSFKFQVSGFKSVHLQSWPEYDAKKIKADAFDLVIQVNGRVRATIKATVGISQTEAEKLAKSSENVKKFLVGEPKKVIFVPNKLINFVI